ncbi:DNA repair protein XRCC2 like [Apostasia shenzhenica]|uniref:DNA repair protein XRCC2 like n=1 Tax=Apostasia shenzhenica TaxID=1088818 RepID=A0A2I0ACT7_9ASPA|nr:DNA repair protein XRCC2 like [Apostasia shenzhenica]
MLARLETERPALLIPPLHRIHIRAGNVAAIHCILPKEWNGVHFGGLERLVAYFDLDCRFDVLRLSQALKHRIMRVYGNASLPAALLSFTKGSSDLLFGIGAGVITSERDALRSAVPKRFCGIIVGSILLGKNRLPFACGDGVKQAIPKMDDILASMGVETHQELIEKVLTKMVDSAVGLLELASYALGQWPVVLLG